LPQQQLFAAPTRQPLYSSATGVPHLDHATPHVHSSSAHARGYRYVESPAGSCPDFQSATPYLSSATSSGLVSLLSLSTASDISQGILIIVFLSHYYNAN
jgi:hypothetical protein